MLNSNYLHCINLYDPLASNNWSIPSARFSVVAANLNALKYPIPTPHYSCNPDDLYSNPERCFAGIGSNYFTTILIASIIRKGQQLLNGYYQPVTLTNEEKEATIFKADLEIELEKIRQTKFRNKPSRLSSLYVVEDSEDGRFCLRQMFFPGVKSGKYKPFIMNVKVILCYSYHKGDIQWLDQYTDTSNKDPLEKYWQGVPFNSTPLSEYVFEGIIIPTNREQIELLRISGVTFSNHDPSPHWQNLYDEDHTAWFNQ